ncbi:MAG: hypothetical protein LBU37_03735 [Tannerellaceae bacterium]|jgi:hypothetical protein|nr:hypothetical protein [Tannerellaceae bacterium]
MKGRYSFQIKQYTIDTPANYFFLLAVSLVFWIIGYVFSVGYPVYGNASSTPLWNMVCSLLPNKGATCLIGLLLTAGGAFLIHRANYVLVIIREKTFLPFLIYVLLVSSNPAFFPLKSISAGVFCLVLAMYQLFISYQDGQATDKAFNTALIIGAGSLFWVYTLWFFPLFWTGMYNFKTLNIRTFLASLIGLSTVYWFLLLWRFLRWDFTSFTVPFSALGNIDFLQVTGIGLIDWVIIIYLAFLTLIASLYIVTHEHDENIRTRQYLFFLIVFAILSFVLFFLYEQSSDEFLCIAYMPVSILLTHFFTVKKGKKRYRGFYLSFVVYIVLSFIRLWNFLLNTVI